MGKEETYKQIDDFFNSKESKNDSRTVGEKYFYVNTQKANNIASFIKYLNEEKKFDFKNSIQVMDLCFGSGNLSSHIALDSDFEISKIYFNDVETSSKITNQDISIDDISEVHNFDFLDFKKFSIYENQIDLLVFNPTISKGDKENSISISEDKIIIENINLTIEESFSNYCKDNSFEIDNLSIDDEEKIITVDFKNKNKNELSILPNSFNNYSIRFKTKNMRTYEDKNSVVVKINQTINSILSEEGIIVFIGTDKDRETIFQNYNTVYKFIQEDNDAFVILNNDFETKECYENEEGNFYKVDCDLKHTISTEIIEDFDKLELELDEYDENSKKIQDINNEEIFRKWLNNNSEITIDEKTKNAYFNGLKRFSNEFSLDVFLLNNISNLKNLEQKLSKDGEYYKYNKEQAYNPSNGLKKYIEFIKEQQNNDVHINDFNKEDKKSYIFSATSKGKENWQDNFKYKNILFKGVPGTGKSRAIDKIIEKHLDIKDEKENILRVNIHSASSNSDLMQGIGISTNTNGNIKYSEKQGLILDIIKRATFHPNQPFVLILEEIQENSLNELIGDLIYLIEDKKRSKLTADNKEYESYESLVNNLVGNKLVEDYVEIPYLVNNSTDYKKMVMPENLFVFCTSNYRDDKKVIEDNLLRRFEVIEIYPNEDFKEFEEYSKEFFKSLNKSILKIMEDEIHPDRFMIGHAIWKDVINEKTFYKAFSKLITEFKDIREIDFDTFKKIIKNTKIKDELNIGIDKLENYYELIKDIQTKIDYEFID